MEIKPEIIQKYGNSEIFKNKGLLFEYMLP